MYKRKYNFTVSIFGNNFLLIRMLIKNIIYNYGYKEDILFDKGPECIRYTALNVRGSNVENKDNDKGINETNGQEYDG